MLNLNPKVMCNSGLELSIQASQFHYCTPRNNEGPWTEVEVGFPSMQVDELLPYMEDLGEGPTESVYPYVPVEIVATVIARHGGIAPQALENHVVAQLEYKP